MSSSILIRKKAQMQMMETVGVLFVFFLLLAFGLIFYAGIQSDKVKETESDQTESDLVDIAETISRLPELKCSEQNSITEKCFDLMSIVSFQKLINDTSGFMTPGTNSRLYYWTLFKNSNITIDVFDEKNKNFSRHEIYYNNDDNKTNKRTNYVPITIRDSRTGEFNFGILYLSVFV